MSWILGQRTKVPGAMLCSKKKKKMLLEFLIQYCENHCHFSEHSHRAIVKQDEREKDSDCYTKYISFHTYAQMSF